MSACEPFSVGGPAGIADALQKVDCLAVEATSVSFGRLFGAQGGLSTALTILLTLYIALLAFNLLTGRSALRISVLTPRMVTMGLVLTFVTSWVAYQSVVWNLAIGAPDQVAGILVGTKGSATMMFAQQLDVFFDAISSAAASITPTQAQAASASLASPSSLLSLAALVLLLGTVGVLVVCRLALAALLILGPVFIVMALFENTRGLFEGWLKSVAMFALVPLLTVVIGSGALMAIAPMVADLGSGGGEISLRAAVSVLVASIIYLSLMLVVFKVAATLTRSWRLARSAAPPSGGSTAAYAEARAPAVSAAGVPVGAAPALSSDRVRTAIASLPASASDDRIAARIAPALLPAPVVASPSVGLEPGAARHSQFYSHRTQGVSSAIPREILK